MICRNCGSSVGDFTRFCTSCGAPMDNGEVVTRLDDEGRPLQDNIIRHGSNNARRQVTVKAVKLRKPWSRKKGIAVLTIFLVAVISVGVYILLGSDKKQEYVYNGESVLMTKAHDRLDGTAELHLGTTGGKVIKLASDAASTYVYNYILDKDGARKYIYFGTDRCLYEVDEDGNREKVSTKVGQDYVETSQDLRKYIFKAGDKNSLYIKVIGEDKEKIEDNVRYAAFLGNDTLAYTDEEDNLYKRYKDGSTKKIDTNVEQFAASYGEDELLVYVKKDGQLFGESSLEGEVIKLTDSPPNLYQGNNDGDIVFTTEDTLFHFDRKSGKVTKIAEEIVNCRVLMDIVVYENSKGVFYTKFGKIEPHALPDMGKLNTEYEYYFTRIGYIGEYLFYISNEGTMYKTKVGSDDKQKIFEGARTIYQTEKKVYFATEDEALYEIDEAGAAIKLNDDVVEIMVSNELGISYRTDNDKLHVGNKQYKDVTRYVPAGENICYVNSKNELYMIKAGGKPQLVCEDIKEYTNIYYGGKLLFRVFEGDGPMPIFTE